METDWHAHTTYSDGSAMAEMVATAEANDLDALGLTDHCIVVDDDFGRRERHDLVETYDRRRDHVEGVRETTDLTVYDAAEVSYVESAEAETAAFLRRAGFDYTIGSVHFAGPYDYTDATQYRDADDRDRREAVERYYDAVVALVESGLFEVLGHLDLPERLGALRGYSTREDYERVASALADSRTVPEVNAGRVHGSLGRVHPDPATFDAFRDRGVGFVAGSDSHSPTQIDERVPALRSVLDDHDVPLAPLGSALWGRT